MKKLRAGIIGTGMAFERLHYPAFQELSDKYEITALCDSDRKKALPWVQKIGLKEQDVYTDFRKMIKRNDLDLVDVMVPIENNFWVTEAVVAEGIPVICEKPVAPNLKQARAHRDLAEKYDVPIMIAENYRYNDDTNIIKNIINEQKMGETIYFIHNRVVDFPKERWGDKFPAKEWRQHPDYKGGAILDMAVHDLSALRHIFGPVDRVHAIGKKQNENWNPYSVINVNILFQSGLPGQFSFFCAGPEAQKPAVGLRIFNANGMIYLENIYSGVINLFYNDGISEQIHFQPQRGFYNELLNFYQAAVGKEKISVTPEIEYGDTKMVFDILKSIETGEFVKVDPEPVFQR